MSEKGYRSAFRLPDLSHAGGHHIVKAGILPVLSERLSVGPESISNWISRRGQRHAELTSLRIQTNAGLSDAQLSLFALEADCQANRSQWASYERKLPPLRPQSMFKSWPNAKVQNRARSLLHDLSTSFPSVESMTALELEKLLQETRNTSLQIRALAGDLEGPPVHGI